MTVTTTPHLNFRGQARGAPAAPTGEDLLVLYLEGDVEAAPLTA
jgi:hypothetical protein